MKRHRVGKGRKWGPRDEALLQTAGKLMMGKRLEIEGPAGRVFYMGSSTVNRRDPFWLEHSGGRIYKERPEELVEWLLPHVGSEALLKAKVHES